jgi:hypothetical protein
MVKRIFLILSLSSGAYGQVVLSEILSNEPSGRVRLEWVEVYNRSQLEIDLHYYPLVVGSDTTSPESGSYLGAGSYAVLARQLLPENGSDSFEGYYGDSSGVWGDSELEDFAAYDVTMGLNNTQGSVILIDSSGNVLDAYAWDRASDDGRSVERNDLFEDNSLWHDCYDVDGSTPGRQNSSIPPEGEDAFSVSVSPKLITPDGDGLEDVFMIDIVIPSGTEITVDIFDDSAMNIRNIVYESSASVSRVEWDGKDDNGGIVSPGIYIIGFFLSGQKKSSRFVPVVVAP